MKSIEEIFNERIRDAPSEHHKKWLATRFDYLMTLGVHMLPNSDIGVIVASNWKAGGAIADSLGAMYELAMLTGHTVVTSINGHMVTIAGKSRHG
jgi:hypothetical protein